MTSQSLNTQTVRVEIPALTEYQLKQLGLLLEGPRLYPKVVDKSIGNKYFAASVRNAIDELSKLVALGLVRHRAVPDDIQHEIQALELTQEGYMLFNERPGHRTIQ